VFRSIDAICDSILILYGRDLYNVFAAFAHCIQQEIYDLIHEGYMDTDLRAAQPSSLVVVPQVSLPTTRRMRYAWDYFVFIYMSHKIKNIKRRQVASGSLDLPTILYLRGADYQLAVSEAGAGVGINTMQDTNFSSILDPLEDRFDVLRALSPGDLDWSMKQIDFYLASHGNYLSSIAEFARSNDGGVFLNPATWKTAVLDLFPAASLYLVYVSNQSNGLLYEIESLSASNLEEHTILVLDENRFGSRESFFAMQARLEEAEKHLYEYVIRDACAVEDPEAFERLLVRFPHTVTLTGDAVAVRREIETLIPVVRREEVERPAEIPFNLGASFSWGMPPEATSSRLPQGRLWPAQRESQMSR
jgi:hypothetical protein